MPVGITVLEETLASVSAMAAATLIGPAEVDALGVLVPPSRHHRQRSRCCWPRCARRRSDHPRHLAGAPLLPDPGAPAAEAVADELISDRSRALKLTAPPAERSRSVLASALWVAKVSAMAAPIAALPAVVSPEALVFVAAVVFAVKVALPDTLVRAPPPCRSRCRGPSA